MAKIVASYNPNITYDAIPISRGRGYWKITIQEYGTRHIPTLRKDHTPKHSSPQYSTERPKLSGQTMSLHNSGQTTAASVPTSIKGQRRPHHYVAALKWKNKQLFTS